MTRVVSFIVLVAILLVIGGLFIRVMAGFLLPLFLAVLLVVMFRPLHLWVISRCQGRNRLAAGITTLAILVIVLAPLLWIAVRAAGEAVSAARQFNKQAVQEKVEKLRRRLGLDVPPRPVQKRLERIEELLASLRDQVVSPDRANDLVKDLENLTVQMERELASSRGNGAGEAVAEMPAPRRENLDRLQHEIDSLKFIPAGAAEFAPALADVEAAYHRFHDDLLGGPLQAWLKRLANPDEEQLAAIRRQIQQFAGPLAVGGAQFAGTFLAEFLIGLAIMIVALYYFLADGPQMIVALMRLSPLDDRYERQLLVEFTTVSRAVVVATLLSALVQGLLAGVGYMLTGLDSVFLLTMLTMLFALIPFVGATAIWLPCSLWLFFYQERTTAAVLLALYGALIVSMADNVIKPLVLQGRSNMHPLLALLSVLGGVKALGPIGILVGPMVVAFLQPLLTMLQTELQSLGRDVPPVPPLGLSPTGKPSA